MAAGLRAARNIRTPKLAHEPSLIAFATEFCQGDLPNATARARIARRLPVSPGGGAKVG